MADLIISVKEARRLLGKDGKNLSDERIEEMIVLLNEIAKAAIKDAQRNRID